MQNQLKTVVMGTGNVLMGDDGIGVHGIRALAKEKLPPHVELIDGGTSALDTIQLLEDINRLIIIDAVKGGGEPGTIYKMNPADIREKKGRNVSLHQLSLLESLNMAKMIGNAPKEVIIIGVEPKEIALGFDLSVELKNKLPRIVEIIKSLV